MNRRNTHRSDSDSNCPISNLTCPLHLRLGLVGRRTLRPPELCDTSNRRKLPHKLPLIRYHTSVQVIANSSQLLLWLRSHYHHDSANLCLRSRQLPLPCHGRDHVSVIEFVPVDCQTDLSVEILLVGCSFRGKQYVSYQCAKLRYSQDLQLVHVTKRHQYRRRFPLMEEDINRTDVDVSSDE